MARELLGSDADEKIALIDRWFSERRMEEFVKADARRKRQADTAHQSIEDEQYKTLGEQMLRLAAKPPANVRGISASPGSKKDYVTLLSDARVDLNAGVDAGSSSASRTPLMELVERVVENRDFIINMLSLDRNEVYSVLPSADAGDEFAQVTCAVCQSADYDAENPILLCDGKHDSAVGYHVRCLGLNHEPAGDWLCPTCVKDGKFIIKSVHGRRKGKGHGGKVEYLVRWVGHGNTESWQRYEDIPDGSKHLTREFNKREKARNETEAGGSGSV